MLHLKNVTAGYKELTVLHDVDIEVRPKEIIALIGPNGAGKSTVIKSVYNIATVTDGSVVFEGEDITHLATHKLMEKGISYVNQERIVFGNLTVRENLEIGAARSADAETVQQNMEHVFTKFPDLRRFQHQLAFGLSGGQQQMVALGRALMNRPKVLLLDEPSLGLSPKLQKELFVHIKKLQKDGIAILIVEQNAKRAIEIADRTYLLESGHVVLTGGKSILRNKKIKNVYLGGS